MAVILLFLAAQIVTILASNCLEGQIRHSYCCEPVWNCKEGYYIKRCERDGGEDECLPCPKGTQNPFNSSSYDIKKCYKSICKLVDSVAVSDNHCECDRSNGWFGENHLACQLKHGGCPAGQELTQIGKCERCTNFHYKDWYGYGFCKKHFNCSALRMDEIKGDSSRGNRCIKKGMTTTTTTPTTTRLTTESTTTTTTKPTTMKATTTKEASPINKIIIKTTQEQHLVLVDPTQSPTKVSRNLPVVGNRGSSDVQVVSHGRIEGILIVAVAILCFLLLVVVCIGTIAYLRRRLKSSPEVTIPNRPALPLPTPQNEHLPEVFTPSVYQTQHQTQPLLQQENPYLCMSNPSHSCVYALPASLHLNSSHSVNYPQSRSPVFDTVSTYGLHFAQPQRQTSTLNPNLPGSQLSLQPRNEHLYMTLPAERSEALVPCENSLASMDSETQFKRPIPFFAPRPPVPNMQYQLNRRSYQLCEDQTNLYADIDI